MSSQGNIDIFRWTARRAAQRPSFVAADLDIYTAIYEISEEELAQLLSCPKEALTDLALCRRPDPSKSSFKTEHDWFSFCERWIQSIPSVPLSAVKAPPTPDC